MKTYYWLSARAMFLAVAFLSISCVDELIPEEAPAKDKGSIALLPRSGNQSAWYTTKGRSITSSGLVQAFSETGINVMALKSEGSSITKYFNEGERLYYKDGSWATANPYYWPTDSEARLSFMAWAFDDSSGGLITDFNPTASSLNFHYKLPEANDEGIDAIKQQELLVAFTKEVSRSNSKEGVVLNFQHALSAVKINVGRTNAGLLHSINFENVYSEADCLVSAENSTSIEWTNHSGKTDFRQDFNISINGNLGEGNYQDISTSAQADSAGLIFMLIPQKLDGANITVDYQLNGKDQSEVFTTQLQGEWVAGRTYTYTLSILGGLSVAIDGTMSAQNANSVGFSNDGDCPCYLRATMVGTWDDAQGNIVQPASGTDIKVVRNSEWDLFWFFDKDSHIYYYRYPLHGGESVAVNLFDSFESASGPDGTLLHMTVMVQAIKHDPDLSSIKQALGYDNSYIEMLHTDFYQN